MVEKNIKIVQSKIAEACSISGRKIDDVKFVAVSKTKPNSDIYSAIRAGLNDFGENKALEFKEKAESIENNVVWHFIGHLQTNKVKYVVPYAEFIHSVESEKLAVEINKRAKKINKIQKIFLEFNTSNEDSKFGLRSFEEGLRLAEFCMQQPNLLLAGLMTMAPFTNDESIIHKSFAKLKNIFDKLNARDFNLSHLSMGMSNDYQIAIEEGSTMVRVGSAIFGARN